MSAHPEITQPPRLAGPTGARRRRLERDPHGSLLFGVSSGLANYLAVDVNLLRVAFGILMLAGGLGLILYLGLALALPEGAADRPPAQRTRGGFRPLAGVGLITAGLLLLGRQSGFWLGDALVIPVAIAALGATVLWTRSGSTTSSGLKVPANPIEVLFQGRVSPTRIVIGAALIVVGVGAFLAVNTDSFYPSRLSLFRLVFFPVVATIAGVVLIFGPWLYRLASQLSDERRELIRSEERAAMAAHLHDSVLQTLALIQRSDSPHRMANLARTQERELRAWLFGRTGGLTDETLSGALEALAGRCEARHEVTVEVVVVGDAPVDERLESLIAACGEALANAATHSGSDRISVYAESEPDLVTLYVRDEGKGFDLASVPGDRRGIRDSIEGRVRRHGGTAVVHSQPGGGTEVMLTMPTSRS